MSARVCLLPGKKACATCDHVSAKGNMNQYTHIRTRCAAVPATDTVVATCARDEYVAILPAVVSTSGLAKVAYVAADAREGRSEGRREGRRSMGRRRCCST